MKSKVNIKGHPLHPILVTFPIAFFVGAFIFDVLAVANDETGFHSTARYLIVGGILSAVLAAVPGFIDLLYTVPPRSSGKKRAVKHGITNVAVLVVFSTALYLRVRDITSINIILIVEFIGVLLLSVAGWLGGTLVYRNQIGVDIRYADAGKWKEEYHKKSPHPIAVATTAEIKINQMKLISVDDKRIVVGRTASGYYAFDDRCTHRGGSLAGGAMICGTVQCPWHGSHFDVQKGDVKAGPAKENIKTYNAFESSGKVFIKL